MAVRCASCGTVAHSSLPLCPICHATALVPLECHDAAAPAETLEQVRRERDELKKKVGDLMDGLNAVYRCHNLATVREAVRRAVAG